MFVQVVQTSLRHELSERERKHRIEAFLRYRTKKSVRYEMVGFYTIPDDSDGVLKVMRSYQFFAASAISNKVAKTNWNKSDQHGGYIWHTTGSGKTMTSFKAAQLISESQDADKVIFLLDRIELGERFTKSIE